MNGRGRVVLVTGASGFIGRYLVPILSQEGWTVRCAVRNEQRGRDEVAVGSVGASTDWSVALSGVEAVVHLAARVHYGIGKGASALYRSINTEGTLRLARAAEHAGVQRFIFVSTMLVNGSSTDGRSPFREDDVLSPRGIYGISKAEAELGLQSLSAQTRMNITIIRPPLVYGSGAKGNFRLLVKAVQKGIPLPFGSIHNRRAFISVQNVVSFIANRLSLADKPFDVFLVADKEQVSTPEFVRRMARAMQKRAYILPFPPAALALLLQSTGRPRLRDSLVGSLEIDLSKAISTGWRQEYSLDEALLMAVR
jgi:UDP-glucose 4-epimerase